MDFVTGTLKTLETSSSIGMFARDTGGCLIARLGLARTKEEAKEITFAETAESALFYFSAPAIAKGTSGLFSKIYNVDKNTMSIPIKDLENISFDKLKNAKLAKMGQLMTTFGLILPFVFGIAPVRNSITEQTSGKEKFTGLIGLENEKQKPQKKSGKTKNIITKLALAAAGALGLGTGILAMCKNKNAYEKMEPVINKTLKHFEFEKSGDLKMAHYGALIYPFSIAGYFAASRDKYEKQENIRRFSTTVPLLFFGEKLIQNPIYKTADRIFKTDVFNKGNIKSYKQILKLPKNEQTRLLKSKNLAFASTFFINTMAIAGAVALLNRIETKKTYEKSRRLNPQNIITLQEFMDITKNKRAV